MATTKLTLSMEPEYIEMAKVYAAQNNISVSKLVKGLIKEVSKKSGKDDPFIEKLKNEEISPKIMALSGILKGKYPDDITLWDAKYEYLKQKHGL
jgi:hypothetical protein